jgi:tRNA-specific 2-thiouridylase
LSKSATQADKELAAKIMLTYTKAMQDGAYAISFDGVEHKSTPLANRDALKPYTLL